VWLFLRHAHVQAMWAVVKPWIHPITVAKVRSLLRRCSIILALTNHKVLLPQPTISTLSHFQMMHTALSHNGSAPRR
jgi:hypothetical protein